MAIQTFTYGQALTSAQMSTLQTNDYNWTVTTQTASYVLVAADKGTTVVMNSASNTTITVNTSLFSAGDTLRIFNIGTGTCTITAGTCTVTTFGSLALGQWGGGTLYFTSASAAIFFPYGGVSYGTATGGTSSSITISGVNYTLLTFTTDGTLTVTKSGLFDYFVMGSGGGSTQFFNGAGGGGGAQFIEGTVYLTANQSVTIGAGGAVNSQNRGVSRIGTGIYALAGSGSTGTRDNAGAYGASGAGGEGDNVSRAGGAAAINAVTGYAGGSNQGTVAPYPGGGGGGFGGIGGNATVGTGGVAGIGLSSSFNGVATTYCRGGYGGISGSGLSNAAANTGNGGGNVSNSYGAGGSGLVMVRFKV